jgi:hypothetical protein
MKTWASRGIAPPFLTLALMEVSGQLWASATLPPEERAPFTHWIGGWLGGPQSQSGRCEEVKNLALLGIEPRLSNL